MKVDNASPSRFPRRHRFAAAAASVTLVSQLGCFSGIASRRCEVGPDRPPRPIDPDCQELYFRPITLSDVFHATRDGLIRRPGVVQQASPGCFRLDAPSGISHALTGDGAVGIQVGDEVILEGVPRDGACRAPECDPGREDHPRKLTPGRTSDSVLPVSIDRTLPA